MESPTLSDWVALVAQACTAMLMLAMGLFSHSSEGLAGKSVRWGLLFCLPYFVEGGPGAAAALITFPLLFVLLASAGYGIRWILVRTRVLGKQRQGNSQLTQ